MRSMRTILLTTCGIHSLVTGLCLGLARPAAADEIRGRVTLGGANHPAPDATIDVEGHIVHADDNGAFVVQDLSSGPHKLTVRYVGLPDVIVNATASDNPASTEVQLSEIDEVVVSGYREAERKALQSKYAAETIQESIYADDVGKLPDQNVAEAVKRLPGVSVANDQGEGRYVIIRGINPNLVNVTINGQNAPVPEPEGRQIKLDDIPSAMIGSVDVIKSLTPDRDANAIAGQVDIGTLSAFQRNKEFFANGRAYIGHYDLNGKSPMGGDVTAGGIFGSDNQFGAVLSFNYDRRPIRSENIQGSTNWRTVGGFTVPDDFRIRDYNLVRKRVGGVANFDWHPSDAVKLHWRSTYSTFSDNEIRDQFRLEIGTAITGQTSTTGNLNTRGTRFIRRREEDDKTFNTNVGGVFDVGSGTLDADFTYSRAEKTDPLRSEYQFRTGTTAIGAAYDVSASPYIVVPNAAGYNPALFAANSVNYDRRIAVDKLYQAAVNYKLPIEVGDNSYVKAGAKLASTIKTNNRDYETYTLSGFTLDDVDYTIGHNTTFDGRYVVGPRISYPGAEALLASRPSVKTLSVSGSLVNDLANDYEVREKVWAAYAMASFKFDSLTVIPGVRVENTDDDLQAKLITATSVLHNTPFNTTGGRSYTNVFPGVNVRYDVEKNLVVRGAVTTSIGRPNYSDLPPYISIDTGAGTVTQGNPNLKPLKAVNGDISVEYYLPSQGVIAVSAFYKHIDDPTYLSGVPGQSGTFGGQSLTNVLVTKPLNADSAIVKGIELNAQTQLTFLPSPLDGFGVGGNITFVDSKERGLFGRTDEVALTLQSNTVASAQLYYEKDGFAARVAYSYRAPYLDTVGTNAATDQFTDSNGSLDARVSYDVISNAQVFLEGANLTDAPWRRYIGVKQQMAEIEHYGWSAKVGLQLKF
jgi:TonB-dependent receptor